VTPDWTFVFATDIHVGSPRSFRFAPAWNENWETARRQIVGIDPDFLVLGGDITRDGSLHRYELEAVKADLDGLPFPCHVVAGNMDTGNKRTTVSGPFPDRDDVALSVQSAQLRQFESVFGPLWWSFDHKGVRVSGFCDMVAGSGLPEEDAFWQWLARQVERPKVKAQVWVTHSPLFVDQPDEPNYDIRSADEYHEFYFNIDEPHRGAILEALEATGTSLVLSGHVHCRKRHTAGGIDFHIGPSTAFSQWEDRWQDGDPTLGFLRCAVRGAAIDVEFVPLKRRSDAKGYGPGGHPRPEARDYSIAWEKG